MFSIVCSHCQTARLSADSMPALKKMFDQCRWLQTGRGADLTYTCPDCFNAITHATAMAFSFPQLAKPAAPPAAPTEPQQLSFL